MVKSILDGNVQKPDFLKYTLPRLAEQWHFKESNSLLKINEPDKKPLSITLADRLDGQLSRDDILFLKSKMGRIVKLLLAKNYSDQKIEQVREEILVQTMSLSLLNFARKTQSSLAGLILTNNDFQRMESRIKHFERCINETPVFSSSVELHSHSVLIYVHKGFVKNSSIITKMTFKALQKLDLIRKSEYPKDILTLLTELS